jgi:transcriptional/translational regulatory protein YebC/TACO1
LAIQKAKKASLQRATIDAAVARGQGLSSSGAKLETFIEGATLSQSPSTALLIDCLTDNQTQTRIDIRAIFKKFGATPSSTTYQFEKIGSIVFFAKEDVDFDAFAEIAIDAGVENFEQDEEGKYMIETEVSSMTSIGNTIREHFGLDMQESEIIWKPSSPQPIVDDEVRMQLHEMVEHLEEVPSVRGVYTNESENDLLGYLTLPSAANRDIIFRAFGYSVHMHIIQSSPLT